MFSCSVYYIVSSKMLALPTRYVSFSALVDLMARVNLIARTGSKTGAFAMSCSWQRLEGSGPIDSPGSRCFVPDELYPQQICGPATGGSGGHGQYVYRNGTLKTYWTFDVHGFTCFKLLGYGFCCLPLGYSVAVLAAYGFLGSCPFASQHRTHLPSIEFQFGSRRHSVFLTCSKFTSACRNVSKVALCTVSSINTDP